MFFNYIIRNEFDISFNKYFSPTLSLYKISNDGKNNSGRFVFYFHYYTSGMTSEMKISSNHAENELNGLFSVFLKI